MAATPITWIDVTNHYASLATSVSVGAQDDILAYVNDEALSPAVFGGEDSRTFKLARIYLAAHFGELEARNARAAGAVGAVAAKTISATSLSVTYGTNGAFNASRDELLSTPGGSAFYAIRRTLVGTRLFSRSPR